MIILLQCTNEKEQSISLSVKTGNAQSGTLIACEQFSLGHNQPNIIYQISPLLPHLKTKVNFYTYPFELEYLLMGENESNFYFYLSFSNPDTLFADITVLF